MHSAQAVSGIAPHEYLAHQYLDKLLRGSLSFEEVNEISLGKVLDEPAQGAHLVTPRLGYTHHGLYAGNDRVIHYSGLADGLSAGPIEEVSFLDFVASQSVTVKPHPKAKYMGGSAVDRARSRLWEERYNLITNNCEHFVYWCLYDRNKSAQVNDVSRLVALAAKRNPVAAIAISAKEASDSIRAYIEGKITKEQMLNEISDTVISSTSILYYGALGQTAIPIPVVGALIGAGVGLMIGNLLNRSGIVALGKSDEVVAAQQRRKAIAEVCQQASAQARAARESLQQLLRTHFMQRNDAFLDAFSSMEQALSDWNSDEFSAALETVNAQFGKTMSYSRFDDFAAAIHNDKPLAF